MIASVYVYNVIEKDDGKKLYPKLYVGKVYIIAYTMKLAALTNKTYLLIKNKSYKLDYLMYYRQKPTYNFCFDIQNLIELFAQLF